MIQMAYLSFASLSLKADADSQIRTILSEANAFNASVGITGQLIYRGGIFLQLLEGERGDVEQLLGRILLDYKRHENLKVLLKQPMKKRIFPDWSMAYVKLDNVALDLVNSIVPWQTLISSSPNQSVSPIEILRVFEELRA